LPEAFNLLDGDLDLENDRPGYVSRRTSVRRRLGATMVGGSLYELSADDCVGPYHLHYGVEEWALVVSGAPVVRTPAGERELRAGDVVCFPVGPEGAHSLRGPGRILVLSAHRSPDTLEYPASGKVGVVPPGKLFRLGDAVDYWSGE
jgi:uncharacterized cupin superfamily protein